MERIFRRIRSHSFVIVFLIALLLVSSYVYLSSTHGKLLSSGIQTTATAIGALIALSAFLISRHEQNVATQITLQGQFFERWAALMKEIQKERGKTAATDDFESLMIEYYQFINYEHDMKRHLNPNIYHMYEAFRIRELTSEQIYAGRTFRGWWEECCCHFVSKEFRKYLNRLIEKNPIPGNANAEETHGTNVAAVSAGSL